MLTEYDFGKRNKFLKSKHSGYCGEMISTFITRYVPFIELCQKIITVITKNVFGKLFLFHLIFKDIFPFGFEAKFS